MFRSRTFSVTYLGVCLALMTLITVGCRQKTYVSQENPNAPLYHAQGVDFNSYDTAVIKLTTKFTSDGDIYKQVNIGENVDESNANAAYSLDKWLSQTGYFEKIEDNADNVSGKAVIIDANVTVEWSSTTNVGTEATTPNAGPVNIKKVRDRVLIGERWGKVSIAYDVFDKDTKKRIAKMHISNAKMYGQGSVVWDEGTRNLAYRQIEKWNQVFVGSVLGLRAARAEVSVTPDL